MLQKIKLIKLISPTTIGQYDCKHRQERGYEIYIYLIIKKIVLQIINTTTTNNKKNLVIMYFNYKYYMNVNMCC